MRALLLALMIVVVGGCALVAPSGSGTGLSDARAVWQEGGSLAVVVTPQGGEPRAITSSHLEAGVNSARLYTLDGATDVEWNTFIYGAAAPGVASVKIDWPGATASPVTDGAWLVVLREKGFKPADLKWQFLDASGKEVESGTGVFPPEA